MPAETYLNSLYASLSNEVVQRAAIEQEGARPKGLNLIEVNSIDLNIEENSGAHHTDFYEQSAGPPYRLIIRRGQTFDMRLHLNRRYDDQIDAIVLQLCFGEHPSVETLTQRMIPLGSLEEELDKKWAAKLLMIDRHYIDIRVLPYANAQVGEWKLNIYAGRRIYEQRRDFYMTYSHPDFLFIIFNPWCQDDSTYLSDEGLRQEYVLNDNGAVYLGGKLNQYQACPWNYGQFEDVSLYAALIALRQGDYMTDRERSDVVLTVRRLTAAVNDNILQGGWSGDYSDGTKPWEWTGTAAILEKYVDSPNERVRYGQCWVFSALLLTLCRSLGIPCRSVTNIRSAHDTDRTLTIDRVYERDVISRKFKQVVGADSVWNFHIWNEAWMTRSDLPRGYDGWQAIDATPQEMSNGRFQCGPMSVKALRLGNVNLNYDGWFIFGEMNADVIHWYYVGDHSAPKGRRLLRAEGDSTRVGRALITSRAGDWTRSDDITDEYKPREGTTEEREQLRKAIRECVDEDRADILELFSMKRGTAVQQQQQKEDIQFNLTDLDGLKVGQTVDSQLILRNMGDRRRLVQVQLQASILRYTGRVQCTMYEKCDYIPLDPNKSHTMNVKLTQNDYSELIGEHSQMCISVLAQVEETDQIFNRKDIFQIVKPQLNLFVENNETHLNRPTSVLIKFSNPYAKQTLTNCNLFLDAVGMARRHPVDIPYSIKAGGEMSVNETVIPHRDGERLLLAVFSSDQLANIRGTLKIRVHN